MTTEPKPPGSRTILSMGAALAGATALLASAVARTPEAPIRFENVSTQSGITFVLDQHATPEKHMVAETKE